METVLALAIPCGAQPVDDGLDLIFVAAMNMATSAGRVAVKNRVLDSFAVVAPRQAKAGIVKFDLLEAT